MKTLKLITCLLFTFIGCVGFAGYTEDFRMADSPENMQAVLTRWEAELPNMTKEEKVKFSGMKMLYYFRTTENPTYAAGRQIYMEQIKKLGVEKEGMESSFLLGPVHPWWCAKKNVALMEEALAYVETLDKVTATQWAEAGRILAFALDRRTEAIEYFESAGPNGYKELIRVYKELGNADKAVETYYKAVESEGMSAKDAAAQFQVIWPLQVKSFKNAEDRAAAKFRLQTLVDQYTNKLYTDTSVKPENSPWRAALTLWTANAK
jgi:tetratricopeptide (TPR) repeat protein